MFAKFLEDSTKRSDSKRGGDGTDEYCVIRWLDGTGFDVVHKRTIKPSSNSLAVFETCTVDFDGKPRKGTAVLIGLIEFLTKKNEYNHVVFVFFCEKEANKIVTNITTMLLLNKQLHVRISFKINKNKKKRNIYPSC